MTSDLLHTLIDLAGRDASEIPPSALRLARLSLFDWAVCGMAGADEPVAGLVRQFAAAEGGAEHASLIGAGKGPARLAALVNGTISHALDYDDTHFAHIGHLSVGIYPAAVAAAEETGASIGEVVSAFLLGAEAAILVGMTLGPDHYNRGFHQTATAGAFGACIAASRIYGLDSSQVAAALGLCATRASGLKSQFGTMGKPYNAGIAASNGVETAKLAQLGFTAPADGLSGVQGFIPTHSDTPRTVADAGRRYRFEDVQYKFHACCHGTHAMIEALLRAREQDRFTPGDVASCRIFTSPRWMNVCNIARPGSGLEIKFSYRWLAGMALDGRPTGSIAIYDQALTEDPQIAALAERVEVVADDSVGEMQTRCEIVLKDGRTIESAFDLDSPAPLSELDRRLAWKARQVLGERADTLEFLRDDAHDGPAGEIGAVLAARLQGSRA